MAGGEVDDRAALPSGADPVVEHADLILTAIAELGGKVGALAESFEHLKIETARQVKVISDRVDGSLPPSKLGASGVAEKPIAEQLREIRATLGEQSTAMGLGLRGASWFASKAGGKAIVRAVTLAGAVYAALHAAGLVGVVH
jgi:hypothetical protein